MWISRVAVERPVFATVISLLLVVVGLGAVFELPVREFPDIDAPVVSISAAYVGASAEVVEREVTEPLEESLSGVEGVDYIDSSSRDGSANIDIEFLLERDLDAAAADVREAVDQASSELPDEIENVTVSKAASDESAIVWFTLTSDKRDREALTDYAERTLVDPMSVVSGVARIQIGGERRYAMRVWLDREAMAGYNITVADIVSVLRAENLELPAGRIESDERELTVRSKTILRRTEAFRELVIRESDGVQVTLDQVARVEIGPEDDRSALFNNDRAAVGLGVVPQSDANNVEVSSGVRAEVERLRGTLPADIDLTLATDDTMFVSGSLEAVVVTLVLAFLVVVAVIYLFLRSFRITLIPAAAVPVSLIASFGAMQAFDFSINTLTLLAMVLAIGLVVDDAIVMLENIYRRAEKGERRLLAAVRGARQVGFAIITTTAVLVAVFLPLAFMQGNVGRLFTEFGISLAAAVTISSIVALTLSPMLCSRLVVAKTRNGVDGNGRKPLFERFADRYQGLVRRALAAPVLTLSLVVLAGASAWLAYQMLPQELAPTEDRSEFIIPVEAPQGSTLKYTREQVEAIRRILEPYRGADGPVRRVVSIIGTGSPGQAFMIAKLKPWAEREMTQQALVREVSPAILALPGVQAFPINPSGLGGGGFSSPVQFVVQGTDRESVERWGVQMAELARGVDGLVNVQTDFEPTKPQVELVVDRRRAADLGISVRDIGTTLQIMLGSQDVTTYQERGEEYEVVLQARDADRDSPRDIDEIFLRADNGELVPLRTLVRREEVGVPPELKRLDRLPAVTLSASLQPGLKLGDALAQLNRLARDNLPPNARIDYLGQSREYHEATGSAFTTFLLALLFVFLVLAALFESFLHPVVILIAVPFAVTGGLLGALITGASFNIYTQIGMILLIGLMAKNGILIVDFANQMRDAGHDVREAVLTASRVRLRPVVMTSVATILGALPLALAFGAGANARQMLGVVVIGGLTLTTLFTLVVVPTLYALLAPFTRPPGAIAQRLRALEREASD